MVETLFRRTLAACTVLAIPVGLAATMYARFFGGFWLGDDFPNLHHSWIAAQRGELLAQTWAQFSSAVPSQGAFYRPMMMASLSFNQWLAGDRFAGWFAFNYAVHLANTGLIVVLVAKLGRACGRDGRTAGAIAAGFFAVCPLLAEGVYWVSARADACVTLLTLTGFFLWTASGAGGKSWLGLPLLLLPALGFKESAAVLPLQMLVVAFAWPRRPTRGQVVAIVASFAVAAAFLGYRIHLFGNAWQVYPGDGSGPAIKLWQGMRSLDAWWGGLAGATPVMAIAYLFAIAATVCTAVASARGSALKLAAALAIASGGLAAATLLNLGSMVPSGEGGRLTYGPVAWLALALGVAFSRPQEDVGAGGENSPVRIAGVLLLAVTVATGSWVLNGVLRVAESTQNEVRELTLAARAWADSHPGLTMLVIPENHGPVIATRNGQGGLVLPPVQPQPLLHRVLPTLPPEIPSRHEQLAAGYATRLESIRPSTVDSQVLRRLFGPDVTRWPEHYACWDASSRRMVELAPPDPRQSTDWDSMLRREIARCGL